MPDQQQLDELREVAAEISHLELLILHGSAARDDDHQHSDLDMAYLSDPPFDRAGAYSRLTVVAGRDDLDLVDLRRASAVLRFRAARDGVLIYERSPGAFVDFAVEAVRYHADAAWTLDRAHSQVLESLGMSPVDPELLAERTGAVERHLRRVSERLPPKPEALRPSSDESDAVILHLWQAVQIVIDIAVTACVRTGLGSPPTYADAFRLLADANLVDEALAQRLARAAGFRNLLVHGYADLDLTLVHAAASGGPADLRAFLASLRKV